MAHAESEIRLKLDEGLVKRLSEIAKYQGFDTDECAFQAIVEYLENWEDYIRSLEIMNEECDHVLLKAS